jgi:hypothetical protein
MDLPHTQHILGIGRGLVLAVTEAQGSCDGEKIACFKGLVCPLAHTVIQME